MRPQDIELLVVPGTPALRGDLLLAAVAAPELDSNAYPGGIHRVALDGGAARWTHGDRDSAPSISPDGRWVAFLRAPGQKDKPQLHVMATDGGDARAVTDLPLGAGAPVWAPDSRRIAFVARVPEPGRYGTPAAEGEDPADPGSEPVRRFTRLTYRWDDLGFVNDRPAHLYVVDAIAGEDPVRLTEGTPEVGGPAWTPDGEHVVVSADRDWGTADTVDSDIYAVPAAGGAPVLVARSAGSATLPAVTDDGHVVYYGTTYTGIHEVARNEGLWSVPLTLDGSPAQPRRLTDEESVGCEPGSGRPVVTADGVLVAVRHRGAVELRRVSLDADGALLSELPVLTGEQGRREVVRRRRFPHRRRGVHMGQHG